MQLIKKKQMKSNLAISNYARTLLSKALESWKFVLTTSLSKRQCLMELQCHLAGLRIADLFNRWRTHTINSKHRKEILEQWLNKAGVFDKLLKNWCGTRCKAPSLFVSLKPGGTVQQSTLPYCRSYRWPLEVYGCSVSPWMTACR